MGCWLANKHVQVLHARERLIFNELIAQGVDETDPDLNDLHR
jgi:hypothetical protein